jgi:hypothetical protein
MEGDHGDVLIGLLSGLVFGAVNAVRQKRGPRIKKTDVTIFWLEVLVPVITMD